ncbi:MAG: hypothetical protein WA130_08205 [Candidatus Methanoperedens sp.]
MQNMTGRSIDIALTQAEAGEKTEIVYENVCTLSTEPELCFNYATTHDLKKWGFSEGCFSCLLKDKKDTIIQVITTYKDNEGAKEAYEADARYLKRHGYGKPVITKTIGESSFMLVKKDSEGITYNLLFLKNNIFAAISAKYKKDIPDNPGHLTRLAEKIEAKIK